MDQKSHINPSVYHQFFHNSDLGLVIEVNSRIVEANHSIISLIGKEEKFIVGSTFDSFIHHDDRSDYLAQCDQLYEGSISNYTSEVRLLTKKGPEIWVKVFCQYKKIEQDSYLFIQVENAHKEIVRKEIFDRFASMMAGVPEESIFDSMVLNLTKILRVKYAFIGFFNREDHAIDIRSVSINNEIKENFSYSLEGTPCLDVMDTGCVVHKSQIQQKYPDDDDLVELEVEGYIGVSLSSTKGESIGHVVVMHDKPIENQNLIISILQIYSGRLASQMESQEQRQLLKSKEEYYRSLFNNSFEAKVIYDESLNTILDVNEAACKLFKYTRDEFIGLTPEAIKPETLEDGSKSTEEVSKNRERLRRNKSVITDTLNKKSDGTVFETELALSYLDQSSNLILVSYRDISEKKKLQKIIETSERRFRSLFENSFDAILLFNGNENTFEACNQRAIGLFGYSREELTSMGPQQLSTPIQEVGVKASRQITEHINRLKEGVKLNFEFTFRKKNGSVFDAEVSLLPILEEKGNYALAVIKDISERKAYLSKIENSERRFRSLFEYSFDAVLVTNTETKKFEDCNEEALKLFGFPRDSLKEKGPLDVLSKNQKDGTYSHDVLKRNIEMVNEGKPLFFEACFTKSNGDIFEGEVSLLPIVDGTKRFAMVVIRNITDQLTYQRTLDEQQEFLETLLNLNPVHIHVKNADGQFLMANEAAAEFFGTTVEKLIGKKAFDFPIKSIGNEDLYLHDSEVINNKRPVEIASRGFFDANGKKCWFQTKKMPLFNERGNVDRILSVSTDITNRIETEEKLRESNEELKKVNEELDHFVYRASHDLRSPLASVLGLVNLLRMECTDGMAHTYVSHIETQIQKLDSFIKDIINYSRVSRLQSKKEEIDFQSLIDEIFESLKYHEKSSSIQKQISIDLERSVRLDQNKVSLILRNLISNAIKYSSSKVENSYINCEVTNLGENGGCQIMVEDNGIGIEKDQVSKIFDMFYRATEESDGSGLGLFIVKEAADKLNAKVKVESEYKKGTRFTVSIPG